MALQPCQCILYVFAVFSCFIHLFTDWFFVVVLRHFPGHVAYFSSIGVCMFHVSWPLEDHVSNGALNMVSSFCSSLAMDLLIMFLIPNQWHHKCRITIAPPHPGLLCSQFNVQTRGSYQSVHVTCVIVARFGRILELARTASIYLVQFRRMGMIGLSRSPFNGGTPWYVAL